jgi:hypothetical protein
MRLGGGGGQGAGRGEWGAEGRVIRELQYESQEANGRYGSAGAQVPRRAGRGATAVYSDLQDEYDDERPVVEKRKEGDYIVNAHASVLDVNSHLPVALPESAEYSTVAGLLNVLFGGIPEVGQSCRDGQYSFKVLKTSRGSVDSVLLKIIPQEGQDT